MRDLEKQAEERVAKKARLEADERVGTEIEGLKARALGVMESQLAAAVRGELRDAELEALSRAQRGVGGEEEEYGGE